MTPPSSIHPTLSTQRLALGGALFVAGLLAPLLIPWVVASGLPTAWKASLSGLLMVGVPDLFGLAAVAILGKEGYTYMKRRLASRIRPAQPPEPVTARRHRIGLTMFATSVLAGWALPYGTAWEPSLHEAEVWVAAGVNVVFLASLFVLGGNFWAKLHALFDREAVARLQETEQELAALVPPDDSKTTGSI